MIWLFGGAGSVTAAAWEVELGAAHPVFGGRLASASGTGVLRGCTADMGNVLEVLGYSAVTDSRGGVNANQAEAKRLCVFGAEVGYAGH
jgi:hypothetical protein